MQTIVIVAFSLDEKARQHHHRGSGHLPREAPGPLGRMVVSCPHHKRRPGCVRGALGPRRGTHRKRGGPVSHDWRTDSARHELVHRLRSMHVGQDRAPQDHDFPGCH